MLSTFKGGVHVDFNKDNTAACPIEAFNSVKTLIFPLTPHANGEYVAHVKPGDQVKMGQLLASSNAPVSDNIYSSVSGVVKAIEDRWHINGLKVKSIVIENDFNDTVDKSIKPCEKDISELTTEEIIEIVKNAGIVGMGGAAFPTHKKIEACVGKINFLLINGAECEPYITCDHRGMIEYPRQIAKGIELVMKAIGVNKAYIAIENNKPDAIETMFTVVRDTNIQVVPLHSKYPQGGEKQLISAVTGIQVPIDKLPIDYGCVVFNVDTCASIYRAYASGLPLVKRVVTVSGTLIKEPKNVLCRIGTPIEELVDFCGGYIEEPEKIIAGGPMMGTAIISDEAPVTKACGAVLAFSKKDIPKGNFSNCIRCGRCKRVCPVNLYPLFINIYSEKSMMDECEKLNATDCIECGCCSYICPAKLYLVQNIKRAKYEVIKNRKLRKTEELKNGK